jgi:aquaporin Z
MSLWKRSAAEFLGTFWLVLGGCGAAILSASFFPGGAGMVGVALAFGLTVVTGMYALGAVSGGHFNPAITLGLATAGRFPMREVIPYWVAQVIGAVVAAAFLYLIANGAPSFDLSTSGFASNGYGAHSPGHYALPACLFAELLLTFMFVVVVLGSTDKLAQKNFAPVAVGLALTLINLVAIPVTNASVNPARSTGPALFEGGWALQQLWLFWVAPLVGGALAGYAYPAFMRERPSAPVPAPPRAEPTEREVSGPREPLPTT